MRRRSWKEGPLEEEGDPAIKLTTPKSRPTPGEEPVGVDHAHLHQAGEVAGELRDEQVELLTTGI